MSDVGSFLDLAIKQAGIDPSSPRTVDLAHALASALAEQNSRPAEARTSFLGRRPATVLTVNLGPPLTADVELNGVTIPGASPQSTYRPVAGDLVWLELSGTDPHISSPLTSDANRKWNTLALSSPWTAYTTGGWGAPGYWRDPLGWVNLRGSATGGSHPSVLGTLPPDCVPVTTHGFAVYVVNTVPAQAAGFIAVNPAGQVIYFGPPTPVQVDLSGVRFRID